MDILSHGLWAVAAAQAVGLRRPITPAQAGATVAMGILPDLGHVLPVAAWSLAQPDPLGLIVAYVQATPGHEPAMPALVYDLSHHLHCLLHSAIVFLLVAVVVWRLAPAWRVVLLGWGLHIALDIPTHSAAYYEVPFLYPLSDRGFDGIAWTTPWVLIANYIALATAFAFLYRRRRARRASLAAAERLSRR